MANNSLVLTPPLTAAYMHRSGPQSTVAYALTLARSLDIDLIIPWNAGGRKVERSRKTDADITEDIKRAEQSLAKIGLWDPRIKSIPEFDSSFEDFVWSHQEKISALDMLMYDCAGCYRERPILPDRNECFFCDEKITSPSVRSRRAQFWNSEDIQSALKTTKTTSAGAINRFKEYQQSEYILMVDRSSEGQARWCLGNATTLNQRYVASLWVSFVQNHFNPDSLAIVAGRTVEHKWLLPTLLWKPKLDITTYVHGLIELPSSGVDARRGYHLALSGADCGKNVSISQNRIQEFDGLIRQVWSLNNLLQTLRAESQHGVGTELKQAFEQIHGGHQLLNNSYNYQGFRQLSTGVKILAKSLKERNQRVVTFEENLVLKQTMVQLKQIVGL